MRRPSYAVDASDACTPPGCVPTAAVQTSAIVRRSSAHSTPDFVSSMRNLGYDIVTSTPEEMAQTLRTEIERWAPIVRASGARVD